MKSRDTLIRLKRFNVDEKRRRVAQIEAIPDEVRPGLSVALQQAVEPMCRLILQTLAGGAS